MRQLPYPGYSWPLTQHATGFNETDIRNMLSCALPFEGRSGVGQEITSLMVNSGVLTANVREGVPDAWRDYQQLLAELGLIVSTRIYPALRLTEVAKSFIAGEVKYSSLMSMQSFRYQYPNGQKHTLQSAQKSALFGSPFSGYENQIDLHVGAGILIRPAILMLRVLYELHMSGDKNPLRLEEVRDFLLPSKMNSEWPQCIIEVKQYRGGMGGGGGGQVDRARRNLQDWFKLLKENPFFDTDGSRYIGLSSYAVSNLDSVTSVITYGEDLGSFWIPTNSSPLERLKWFSWYGQFGDVIEPVEASEASVVVLDDSMVDDDEMSAPTTMPVFLNEIDEESLLKKKEISFNVDEAVVARNAMLGAMKRYAKHVLHDEIVAEFSQKFKAQGAKVFSDPNTVDLLVMWGESSAMFEVKTVNHRNFQTRIRLALGQVEEYSFRLLKDIGIRPDRGIIINRSISRDSWQAEFLSQHMNVGIVSRTSAGTQVIKPRVCGSCSFWD